MATITINGKEREVVSGTSVWRRVESLGLHPQAVAVEYNREILRRDDYTETALVDGDQLEIVRFVQGG
jgi:sulfur carrier protein